MRAVFVASEISPFASTGGLADVAQALPKALSQRDVEITRIMPYYRFVNDTDYDIHDTGITLNIPIGLVNYTAEIWEAREPQPKTYLIRRDEYFDRRYLYAMPHREYEDNFERYVFFQKAVVALIDALGLKPDIVHCNDWQTGLLPLFLNYGLLGQGRVRKEKTVFTIHNLAYQGTFPGSLFPLANLPFSCFSIEQLEFFGQVNCMKGGITTADLLTTVSPTYAQEIQSEILGCGLHGVLSNRRSELYGITNGVDYSKWDPAHDPDIKAQYDHTDLSGKKKCRNALLERMNISASVNTPIIGIVTRLTEQKGLDLISEAMEALMEHPLVMVVLGSGEERYQQLCHAWAERWPDKFAFQQAFDPKLAHQIEAGADIFLMPSRYEPCGLNQLYSQRYGTIPIVHATGGLKDTILDLTSNPAKGNGFSFDSYTAEDLLSAIKRCLDEYKNRSNWTKILKRIMQNDYSWHQSADQYIELYENLLL